MGRPPTSRPLFRKPGGLAARPPGGVAAPCSENRVGWRPRLAQPIFSILPTDFFIWPTDKQGFPKPGGLGRQCQMPVSQAGRSLGRGKPKPGGLGQKIALRKTQKMRSKKTQQKTLCNRKPGGLVAQIRAGAGRKLGGLVAQVRVGWSKSGGRAENRVGWQPKSEWGGRTLAEWGRKPGGVVAPDGVQLCVGSKKGAGSFPTSGRNLYGLVA